MPLWALDTIILPQCWQKAWHDKEVLSYAINPFKIYIKFNQALTSAHIRGKHFILSGKSKRQWWKSKGICSCSHEYQLALWVKTILWLGVHSSAMLDTKQAISVLFVSFFHSFLLSLGPILGFIYTVIVKGSLCAGMASALCIRDICLLLLILIIIVYLIWFQRSFLSSLWCCYISLALSKIKVKHKNNVKRRKSVALVFALWIKFIHSKLNELVLLLLWVTIH